MSVDETTARLAAFTAELTLRDIPDVVIARVKGLLADAIASALAGWTSPQSHQVADMAEKIYGAGESTVLGAASGSLGGAVVINGYLTTARSVCDVHQPTLCHVMPVVMPPAIGLAEAENVAGPDLVAGLAAGAEVTARVGLGLDYARFRARGWHSPGVSGMIGSAAGASRVLGLDADVTEQAMGIAGAQAGGTFASFGTPTIKFHQARAALGALMATTLASKSFQGPRGILTNPDGGVFPAFSGGGDSLAALDGLGERWELMEITTRPWPAAVALQAVVTIVEEEAIPDVSELDAVEVGLPPRAFVMHAEMGWRDAFEAALSARFAASLAIHGGSFWDLSEQTLSNREIIRFAQEKVEIVEAGDLPEGGARLTARVGNRELTWQRQHPRGSPRAPASWADVTRKLHLAGQELGKESVTRIEQSVEQLESLAEVRSLIRETRMVKGD